MQRKAISVAVSILVLLAAVSICSAASSQSSFSVSPPPIANPVFDSREKDMKIRGTYLTMESTDPAFDFELSGYGVDAVMRKAFGNRFAMDFNYGVTYLDGDLGSTGTLNGISIPFSFNLEVEPFKSDILNVIVFFGPSFNMSAMSMETSYIGYSGQETTMTTTVDSFMYGAQGGVQLGFTFGPIGVDAFGMTASQKGSQSTYSSYGGSTSTDIPTMTTNTFGVDFIIVPWGLALSSVLQEAGKGKSEGESSGFKTHLYQLSWSHKY